MKEKNAIRQPEDEIEIPLPVVPVLLIMLGAILYVTFWVAR